MSAQVQHQPLRSAASLYREERRAPFTNASNHPPSAHPTSPLKRVAEKKVPASPPLPRQNTKTAPPSPPQVIRDNHHSISYTRVGFLGEGGFARVFEVEDHKRVRSAIKVVTKDSLKTKKAKTKLYAEIKIHRSLRHPNIVRFGDCFEDTSNVYMTLELCESGSLMDMLRRRRRFTEPESRFFMVQLIGACHYMHTHQVIHRDLKLGNLFLDADMNVKVGDFGLAALIENPGERKKTICGTPNYIAPEVLFDTANGHSFEVDTWSVGVILYTLVVGRPPFQTKEVKEIYKRIRNNEYEFPMERNVSDDVRELIQQILTPKPQERPTLYDILSHPFFTAGIVPAYIPHTAQDHAPSFKHITPPISKINLARLRKNALLDEEQSSDIAVSILHPGISAASGYSKSNSAANSAIVNSSVALAQQEREFQRAVQPSSPISALLGAARQPLVMAAAQASSNREREQPLIRKLQAAAIDRTSPAKSTNLNQASAIGLGSSSNGRVGGYARSTGLQNIEEENASDEQQVDRVRRKELEAQKARIVAQMVPNTVPSALASEPSDEGDIETENIPPVPHERINQKVAVKQVDSRASKSQKLHGFDAAAFVLTQALDARSKGKIFKHPMENQEITDAKVFIVSWVDYCNKYGMGYALTDGSVGVHFNDSTSVVLAPDKHHLDYIESRQGGSAFTRKNYTMTNYPTDLKSKIYLLTHFKQYIMERLYGDYPFTYEDLNRTKGMDFVQNYLRMKQVIVFKLSHDVLQFNFYDHTKVILSSQALRVTHINKDYEVTNWSLSEVMSRSLDLPSDPIEAKFILRLAEKLKYCKEVLLSIKNASTNVNPE